MKISSITVKVLFASVSILLIGKYNGADCSENDCGEYGTCNESTNTCTCLDTFIQVSSNVCGCEPESCGGRGECINPLTGVCDCDDPFVPWGNAICDCLNDEVYDHETEECMDDLCMDNTCSGRGHCIDPVRGVCECYDGYEPIEPGVCGCPIDRPIHAYGGFFGGECVEDRCIENLCGGSPKHGARGDCVDPVDGECICDAGFENDYYDPSICTCPDGEVFDDDSGECMESACAGNNCCGRGFCVDHEDGWCNCDEPFEAVAPGICECPRGLFYDYYSDQCIPDACYFDYYYYYYYYYNYQPKFPIRRELFQDFLPCSGRGECVDSYTGRCECNAPFVPDEGLECICPQDQVEHEIMGEETCVDNLCIGNSCSGRGNCIDPISGLCDCIAPFLQ
ncbi:hypothetical protein CTEN210_13246 [Chaetoceros tenuissimus]|uniref:EGF-like domain-containing protein n=1 Tax=Chaetoceros tenuissimus TaxID=426638 RepID=A0AAD3D578_9STRA|nr:hypothetical protein CTEN210_13246 [Chaetoceros tenuissimus]